MNNNLTPKQEKFVQGLVSGLSQRQAYKEAYDVSNMKDETIDSRASRLFKEYKISARYNELMEEHKNKALWTREEAVNTLKWLMSKAVNSIESEEFDGGYVRKSTSDAILTAIQELNKLEDLYPNNKTDVNLNGTVVFANEDSIED